MRFLFSILFVSAIAAATSPDCRREARLLVRNGGLPGAPFMTNRALGGWRRVFSESLIARLQTLGSAARILDLGAGECYAAEMMRMTKEQYQQVVQKMEAQARAHPNDILFAQDLLHLKSMAEFFDRPPAERPSVVAVTARLMRPKPVVPGLEILAGDFFGDIPAEKLGTFDQIVDLYGVMAYTEHPEKDCVKAVSLLRPGGEFTFNRGGVWGGRVLHKRVPNGTRVLYEKLVKAGAPYDFIPAADGIHGELALKPGSFELTTDIKEALEAHSELATPWDVWAKKESKGIDWKISKTAFVLSAKAGEKPFLPGLELVAIRPDSPPTRYFVPK